MVVLPRWLSLVRPNDNENEQTETPSAREPWLVTLATPSSDGGPMKITPWYLAALAPFAAIGCSGAYLGHAAVVMLTLGIFLGTLSLGRTASTPPQPPTIS